MKQLTCEMCGSTELLKQDGVFICQTCGTKYSVEEAKRMMVEGTVDVQGTVKVDNSAFVEKYLTNARRAKQKEDWEETEKYYNMVEQNDPTNIEAIFYSSYGKAKSSLIDGDLYKRQAAFKVLQNCVSIVDDNFNMDKEEDEKEIIKQISTDIIAMSGSTYVYNQRKNGYGIVTWTDENETNQLFINLNNEFCTTLDEIVKKYPENDSRIAYFYELAILHKNVMLTLGLANPQYTRNAIQKYHEKWHIIDQSHDIPAPVENTKESGCYVATAVYGSYDCPPVWTLRRYRDYTLAETWYGRAFIKTYYGISPTLVKWFGDTNWFKKMWHGKLDKIVKKLNESGVEDTPYEDKRW
ncbi:MAG: hypothetical protein NC177_18280 [Ruminococcus flavefaciens]|nr:hypothetical protein [Ruminococcus flavefaciens]